MHQVEHNEEIINFLNKKISEYLVQINALDLPEKDVKTISSLFHIVNDLERIGDHAVNIAEDAGRCIESNMALSDDALDEVTELYDDVLVALDHSLGIFRSHRFNAEKSAEMERMEDGIDEKSSLLRDHHIERLNDGLCSPEAGIIFSNFIANIERVADHATNIARSLENPQDIKQRRIKLEAAN